MQWEELTEPRFRKAVADTGVCVVAMGVVEKHADHLPLGTDFLNAHRIACLASEIESAVVFPPFYFGQIYEARCFSGTLTLSPKLLLQLIHEVFDEIGRNGFRKIIIYNGHGGNNSLLPFIAQCSLWEQKPYTLYLYRGLSERDREAWKKVLETEEHGHACECETSISLANFEHLVDGEAMASAEPAKALGRMRHLPQAYLGISWYADYPNHYARDARSANKHKGEKLRRLIVDSLASFIGEVKKDKTAPTLQEEYFQRGSRLQNRP